MDKESTTTGGAGILGLLGLLFIALKLTGVIDWSWWLVLMPFWIGAALFILGLLVVLVIFLITKKR